MGISYCLKDIFLQAAKPIKPFYVRTILWYNRSDIERYLEGDLKVDEIVDLFADIQMNIFKHLPDKKRPYFENLDIKGKRGCVLYGPRGVGKTTFLVNYASENNLLYLSADHPIVLTSSLWDIAKEAFENDFAGIVIDEAHSAKDWSSHIKAIYDSYPSYQIVVSDSSIVLKKSMTDLSRRFPMLRMPYLSLNEYIAFETGYKFDSFNVFENKQGCAQIAKNIDILKVFRKYMNEGFRPIYLEGSYSERLFNIIDKTIYADVPSLIKVSDERYLRAMRAIVGDISQQLVPTLNIERFSKEWSIGKEKTYDLLNILNDIDLLTIVYTKKNKTNRGKGAKIFFSDPSIYSVLKGQIANAREAYVVHSFKQIGKEIYASSDESKGDFETQYGSLEVGGKSKKPKEADFVIRDDTVLPSKRGVPLWSLGFLSL